MKKSKTSFKGKYCHHCGEKLTKNAKFCKQCGKKVGDDSGEKSNVFA